MNENTFLFEVEERVEILRGNERFGVVVATDSDSDGNYYQIELEDNGALRWMGEDDLGSVPTRKEIQQFAGLVSRVLDRLQKSA